MSLQETFLLEVFAINEGNCILLSFVSFTLKKDVLTDAKITFRINGNLGEVLETDSQNARLIIAASRFQSRFARI